jgi:hypothetical protein
MVIMDPLFNATSLASSNALIDSSVASSTILLGATFYQYFDPCQLALGGCFITSLYITFEHMKL